MIHSNVDEIKALFSTLVVEVQSALQSQSDIRKVRHFLITFFKCNFPETFNLEKLFTTITLNDLWDYHHFSPLERLVNKFLPNDQKVGSLMKAYCTRLVSLDSTSQQSLSIISSTRICLQMILMRTVINPLQTSPQSNTKRSRWCFNLSERYRRFR